MHQRPYSKALSGLLIFLGSYLLFANISAYILVGIGGFFNILISPGIFFRNTFLGMSFYIPAYIFVCALILKKQIIRKDIIFVLNMSLIVFLTLSLFFRLLFYKEPSLFLDLFINAFGRRSGSFFIFLLSFVEVILIYTLKLHFFNTKSNIKPSGSIQSESILFSDNQEPFSEIKNPKIDLNMDSDYEEFEEKALVVQEAIQVLVDEEIDYSVDENNMEQEPVEDSDETEFENETLSSDIIAIPSLEQSQTQLILKEKAELLVSSGIEEVAELEPVMDDEAEPEEENNVNQTVYAEYSLVEEAEKVIEAEQVKEDSSEEVIVREAKAPQTSRKYKYSVPSEGILEEYSDGSYKNIGDDTKKAAEVLKTTLEEFKIQAEVTGIKKGPVITMFEILPAPGVKLSKIVNLADNIALRLAASRLRIVAPIPGKHAVGIEVPNKKRAKVSFKEIIEEDEFVNGKKNIPIVLGKDITGGSQVVDLTRTPHLLIAGATGSGKSVCVNSIIASILYRRTPEEVKLILIDPKIVELKLYNGIPHLLTPVITESKKAFQALQYCLYEMERRYTLLDSLGVRDMKSYNKKIKVKKIATLPLPYIVIVVDEFADLMATSGKELESTLARLAAMSRAVGIHLVLATQRPSIDVITGLIKANIPSRIAFMVAGKFDSRIIIDCVGAEKLLGQGDMLFTSAWDPFPSRIQGAYLSEEEVEKIANHVRTLGEPDYIDDEIFIDEDEEDQLNLFSGNAGDPLLEKAILIISSTRKASASYLQRRLKVGYNRAARMIEDLEARGIVGPQNGSKAREILHIPDKYKE